MIRLVLAGLDTLVSSPICARCPSGPAGCCAAPPALTWVDLGRIAAHGGVDWILGEIQAGRLRRCLRGLAMVRVSGPFGVACTYLGQAGCVLPPNRRSVTCNEYLCEDALAIAQAEGDPLANAARAAHAEVETTLSALDDDLSRQVAAREAASHGPIAVDADLLNWLRAELDVLEGAARPTHPCVGRTQAPDESVRGEASDEGRSRLARPRQ